VDMDEAGQLRLLEEVFARHTEDFRGFPLKSRGNDLEFSFDNDQISGADPFTIYALTRHLRPKRIVEVGSGYSTLVTSRAVRENGSGSILCVEPYPRAFLERAVEGVGEVRRQPVQDTPLEVFEELGAGDILFIDSTHTVRIGGDVNRLFLEILPRLKPGVWVHVHDIFLPHDYPAMDRGDALLLGRTIPVAGLPLLQPRLPRAFRRGLHGPSASRPHAGLFPGYQLGMGGGSFWMERVAV
jgi:Predicted O-methyltransferase